jgi:hypothetical protein
VRLGFAWSRRAKAEEGLGFLLAWLKKTLWLGRLVVESLLGLKGSLGRLLGLLLLLLLLLFWSKAKVGLVCCSLLLSSLSLCRSYDTADDDGNKRLGLYLAKGFLGGTHNNKRLIWSAWLAF